MSGHGLSRRRALALGAAAALARTWPAHAHAQGAPDLSALRDAIRQRVGPDTVFDLDASLADEVFLQATKRDALPDGYRPADLVPTGGGQLIRRLILDDTRALISAASDAGLSVYVGSGFRSQAYQVDVFAAQTARWGDEEVANRYSARPGHSQHQLGTTIDFTTNFREFRTSGAAEWLRAHAHEYGFVLPYTPAAVELTGYVDEPWHARWLGPGLAGLVQSFGYQEWQTLDADDVVGIVRIEAGFG